MKEVQRLALASALLVPAGVVIGYALTGLTDLTNNAIDALIDKADEAEKYKNDIGPKKEHIRSTRVRNTTHKSFEDIVENY